MAAISITRIDANNEQTIYCYDSPYDKVTTLAACVVRFFFNIKTSDEIFNLKLLTVKLQVRKTANKFYAWGDTVTSTIFCTRI